MPCFGQKTDMYLSDALVQIIKDLRNGRILGDTTVVKKDTALKDSFFAGAVSIF